MASRIFYLCPDVAEPAGGIKVIYQHVQMLNENGIEAWVVHMQENFRCTWFDAEVPVLWARTIRFTRDDLIVMPTVWALVLLKDFAPGSRKIINQGAYLTFGGYPIDEIGVETPYRHPDVKAAIVVSEDSKRYLEYAYPGLPVTRVRNYIDSNVFPFSEQKKKQIAFFMRKRRQDIEQVINLLRYRDAFGGFHLAPIQNRPEHEVAAILGESALFMNFCMEEGWSLPAAEAMSSGCLVVGNHGYGARELLLPEFSWPIEQGDIIAFAQTLEAVIREYNASPAALREKARTGAEFIHTHYNREVSAAELVAFWRDFL